MQTPQSTGVALAAALLLLAAPAMTGAQIVRDGTLGNGKNQPLPGPNYQITDDLGEARGENLFHSFSEFSVPTDHHARFGGVPFKHVIARVTGEKGSWIDGTVSLDPASSANLFLINPWGVMFGANATIDVPASFRASTADSVLLGEGMDAGSFSARLTEETTLSVAAPKAFGFLGDLRHSVTVSGEPGSPSFIFDLEPEVSLALVGGDVAVENSRLESPRGTIDIVAVGTQKVEIPFDSLEAQAPGLDGTVDIHASTLDTSEDGSEKAGTISILGGTMTIDGGSRLRSDANGFLTGAEAGTISIGTEAAPARQIDITDASISTSAFVFGSDLGTPGGEIVIVGDTIRIMGPETEIRSESNRKSGSITVLGGSHLGIGDRARISTNSTESGVAGRVDLDADVVELSGLASVRSSALADGEGGDVRIGVRAGAGSVEIRDASVTTSAVLEGVAGDVEIAASGSIRVSGPQAEISSEAAVRNAGTIRLEAHDFAMSDGAVVSTSVSSFDSEATSAAGSIDIVAREISLSGGSEIRSEALGAAQAGTISLGTPDAPAKKIVLSDARVSTFAFQGPARPPIGTPPEEVDAAREGNIALHATDEVRLERGASITASVGEGLGGSIRIADPDLTVLRDHAAILAETEDGAGGRIEISTLFFIAEPGTVVSADAGVGNTGTVSISSPEVTLESDLQRLSADFVDAADLVRPSCSARAADTGGSFVVARRRGLPASPEGLLVAFDASGYESASLPSVSAAPGGASSALVAAAEGAGAFRGGRFEQAAERWREASRLCSGAEEASCRADTLRGLAQSQQAMGGYAESVATLEQALADAERSGDPARVSSALGNLGNAYVALGEHKAADEALERAVEMARDAGRPKLAAVMLNNRANEHVVRGSLAWALEAYEQSAALAAESGDKVNEAKALSNAGRAALDAGDLERAQSLMDRALARASSLSLSHHQSYVLIHVAKSYEQMAKGAPERRESALLLAHNALQRAITVGRRLENDRVLSYALGNLGALYAEDGSPDEALYLTRQALRVAERADAPESIYRWHWQEGRLLWAQGRRNDAIRSYQRAVDLLDETRQESQARYGSSAAYFREAVAPVYMDLADALLQGADGLDDPQKSRALLVEARATVERLKAAELRDYFRDECVADLESRTVDLDRLSERAAVVYPVMLADRLELLVTLPSGLRRYKVGVSARELTEQAHRFRLDLETRTTNRYRRGAAQLHAWLVAPYETELEKAGIDTIVFVPDGALRLIPMAALHDGSDFLGSRYALAVTPGLSLVDPRALDAENARLLLAGVSESVEGSSPLAHVPDELGEIRELYGRGKIMLDAQFTGDRFAEEIERERPSIVHVASHAMFTGEAASSFLLAHDQKIGMDRLASIVAVAKYRSEDPLELLTLSACATAAGDDRAALGLSGIAIRAGARSAVGSLWSVSDQATRELMVEFYRQLKDPALSKAQAMQRAQATLRDKPEFAHPFYWAPFLLINNWL